MPTIILRTLTEDDEEAFLMAYHADWEKNFVFAHYFDSLAQKNFSLYCKVLLQLHDKSFLPPGHVPCTFLFAFNQEGSIVGRVSIRHELTEELLKWGGHIGYGVVPAFRKQGYATEILKESLLYVKVNFPHLHQVLLTCDQGNIGSQKTIEKNNGVLENILMTQDHIKKMRFWIKIS